MKFKFKAGSEFDILTDDELGKRLDDFDARMAQRSDERCGTILRQIAQPFSTDANGDANGLVFQVPVGYICFLHRLTIDYPGSDATTPAACDVRIFGNDPTPTTLRDIVAALPNVFTAGNEKVAPLFNGGESIMVGIDGGPTTTNIYCSVQVHLLRQKTPPAVPDAPTDS